MKNTLTFIIFSILFAVAVVSWGLHVQFTRADETPDLAWEQVGATPYPRYTPTTSTQSTATPQASASPLAQVDLPKKVQLDVEFTSQAPQGNWDALHEDACEEASFLMVKHYIEGTSLGSKDSIDREIVDLVNFGESRGLGKSITLDQLNTSVMARYGIQNGKVVRLSSLDDIKRELAAGHPVIVGMAGRLLNNPNFTAGGPVYHMLVVTGYDSHGFITNDPGTRKGEGYRYDYATFDQALHDWNEDNILHGQRAYLVYR